MKLDFKKELFLAIMPELPSVLIQHFEETPDGELDPDWNLYLRMEIAGALHCITARYEGKLVGYYMAIVQSHLHDRKLRVAYVNLWYVLPKYRRKNGTPLLRKGEAMLRELGVRRVTLAIPASSNIPFLPAGLGYTLSEKSYRKEL